MVGSGSSSSRRRPRRRLRHLSSPRSGSDSGSVKKHRTGAATAAAINQSARQC